jgi:CheY-like chemotaxis protein
VITNSELLFALSTCPDAVINLSNTDSTIASNRQEAVPVNGSASSQGFQSPLVIIIDNDENQRTHFTRILQDAKMHSKLQFVAEEAEAIERMQLNANRLQAVFIGLYLLASVNFKFLKTIKADNRLRSLPIIIMTDSAALEQVLECQKYGGNAFVAKPLNLRSFTKEVIAAINLEGEGTACARSEKVLGREDYVEKNL